METESEYESREFHSHLAALKAVEQAPLQDRKDAAAEWGDALRNPRLIAERLSWLWQGAYGKGAQIDARRIVFSGPRINKVAALSQLLAAVEWRCSAPMARLAWKALTPAEQGAADAAITAGIRQAMGESDDA